MRTQIRKLVQLLLTATVVLCFTADATAQQATAKIVGTVTDVQGAVVPGVKVTVTNTATNIRRNHDRQEWFLPGLGSADRHLPDCGQPRKVFDRWK